MEHKIKTLLLENTNELFGNTIDEKIIQFQKTRKEVAGDLTLVTFPFSKMLSVSPQAAAEKIGAFLIEKLPELDSFEVINGFLNLTISQSFWINQLNEQNANERYGYEQ